jgi:hypothetical protein
VAVHSSGHAGSLTAERFPAEKVKELTTIVSALQRKGFTLIEIGAPAICVHIETTPVNQLAAFRSAAFDL